MNYDKVKKNVYYDPPDEYPHSSRNHAEDFADYHLPLGQMHHGAIHDRGIALGLELSGAVNAIEVVINAGVAVDGAGQMIVLATSGHGDIGDDPPVGDNNEMPVPVHLPLGPQSNKTVYVTIQFSEILRPNEGSGGRKEQVPWLRLQPVSGPGAYVDDGTSVILGIVVIGANGALVSLKEQDGAVAYRRRSLGQSLEELRVRRPVKNGNQLQETVAARLNSPPGGGLQVGVTNAGDAILLAKDDGNQCARVETRAGLVVCKDSAGREVIHIDANNAWLRVGAQGNEGDIIVHDQNGNPAMLFDSSGGALNIGTSKNSGHVIVRDLASNPGVLLDGAASRVTTNNLNALGDRNAIDANVRFFRIHGWDLILDGRSGGNKRALVDNNNELVINYANDYANGVRLGGNLKDKDGVLLMGNPARKVLFDFLLTDETAAWVTLNINLPGARQFFAYTAIVMINSTTDFDYDNAVFSDILFLDGNPTGSWVSGNGSNFGGSGDARNMHPPFAQGVAQTITFRLASLGPDIQAAAIAVVFYE